MATSTNAELWSFRGNQCSVDLLNGCTVDLTTKQFIGIGDQTFHVAHGPICVGECGSVQMVSSEVGLFDVVLDQALAADVDFGDIWYGPLGKEYYVVGTPTKPGTFNGQAALAGASCITVIAGCACRENVGACTQVVNATIDTASTQIDSVVIGPKTVTGPWTVATFLDPVSGIKAMLRAAGCQIDTFDWDTATGEICITGLGIADEGTTVTINHSS